MQKYPPPDAPPDTDISPGGHSDAIKKGDEGFETWVGKWKKGYPKAEVE